jgi:predicted  nucleic acid-binding Zn-ribbon protein
MRTSKEVREELKKVREELEDIKRNSNATDETEDILEGWVKALNWVLSEYKEEEA